ncbi:hypothetical protein Q5741_00525 [Paenibacillus sp. JX-17]|uniref:VCBS repeat-containing protein n=1 Tax=Paenibacillus lacisoli TaxID=3064525 RepID=A0ABT9C6K0_9BACL|nr:hypothetical protein [Paenibacillus sp. JX-17]MDO7904892.1 hypothetical protein [Paenibacillus sp. JX-17]
MKLFKASWMTSLVGAAGLLCMPLLLSGCDLMRDPVSLMNTPIMSTDKEKLVSVINTQLRDIPGATLLRPRDPDDSNTIRRGDLNNDGTEEAVVFYEAPDDTPRIHGMLLEEQQGTWVKKLTFEGKGLELESLKLVDLTNDGQLDIVAGYSTGDDQDGQNLLVVYRYNGSSIEKVLEMPYSKFLVEDNRREPLDLNGDGINDLTVISYKQNEMPSVTTYQYNGSFQEIGKLDLDNTVNNFYNIVAGKIAKNKEGIIIDTQLAAHSYYSSMITMNNEVMEEVQLQDHTQKDAMIKSGDVDGDGIIEYGILKRPDGWEHFAPDDVPFFVNYYQWDGKNGSKFVMQKYEDFEDRFSLKIPSDLYGKVTLDTKSQKDKYLKFIKTDTGQTLAEIKFFTLQQWEDAKGSWEERIRDKDRVVGIKLHGEFLENKLNNSGLSDRKGVKQ